MTTVQPDCDIVLTWAPTPTYHETEPKDRLQWVSEPLPELEPPQRLLIHYDNRTEQATLLWNKYRRHVSAAAPKVISTHTSVLQARNAGYRWYRYARLLRQIRAEIPRTRAETQAAITALLNGETVDQPPPEWSV